MIAITNKQLDQRKLKAFCISWRCWPMAMLGRITHADRSLRCFEPHHFGSLTQAKSGGEWFVCQNENRGRHCDKAGRLR
jgi:hypothetical protein